jgi:type III secretion protein J
MMLRIALIAVALALTGCSKVSLYSQLNEQQANEMLALLLNAGVDADKESAEGKAWLLRTEKADVPRALDVLRSYGYPRDQFQSLGDIFKKESYVSSPLEERVRYVYGLSQELGRTLSSIDGVTSARVHVALPEKDALSDKIRASSASVFIKHRPDAKIANHIAAIKALVVNSVEGLPYDNVTVTLFATDALHDRTEPTPSGVRPAANFLQQPWNFLEQPWTYPVAVTVFALILLVVLAMRIRARPRPETSGV